MNDWDQDPKLAKVPMGMPTAPAPTAELLKLAEKMGDDSFDPRLLTEEENDAIVAALRKAAAVERVDLSPCPEGPAPALQAPHNSGERVRNGDTVLAGAGAERAEVAGEAEPVAWRWKLLGGFWQYAASDSAFPDGAGTLEPLYTRGPPPRSEGVRASEVRSGEVDQGRPACGQGDEFGHSRLATRSADTPEREVVAWRKLGLRILSYFDLNARPENDLAQGYRAELAALLFDAPVGSGTVAQAPMQRALELLEDAPAAALRALVIEECQTAIEALRIRAATDFKDPKCAGQRGQDRCDALYDAYQAVKALAAPSAQEKTP